MPAASSDERECVYNSAILQALPGASMVRESRQYYPGVGYQSARASVAARRLRSSRVSEESLAAVFLTSLAVRT